MPHLLLAYDFPPLGGGLARYMAELVRAYPDGRLTVSTGGRGDGEPLEGDLERRVDRLAMPARRLRTMQGLLLWSRRAARLCRQAGTEFIWCGNFKPAAYPARWARERTGTPYGIIVHGTDMLLLQHQVHQSRLKRKVARALFRPASVIVANSHYTRELALTVLRELGFSPADDMVRVVPLGTDPATFHPEIPVADVARRHGIDPAKRWLLTVARLTMHKGIDTVIAALAQLRDEFPDLGYLVVGRGDRRRDLEAQARGSGVGDRVRFLEAVPDADLPALYNLATLYLGVSRRTESMVEGFGISLVEASASGVPVIAGRSGGIPDAVKDGETGLLVDSEHPTPVVRAIRELLENPERARNLGQGGRLAVEQYYNWTRVARDIAAIGDGVAAAAR
jgi:phosphatidylinositol alpha-1,6-mannosyltransferase